MILKDPDGINIMWLRDALICCCLLWPFSFLGMENHITICTTNISLIVRARVRINLQRTVTTILYNIRYTYIFSTPFESKNNVKHFVANNYKNVATTCDYMYLLFYNLLRVRFKKS